MDYMNELDSISKEHGGIVETKVAITHGISNVAFLKTLQHWMSDENFETTMDIYTEVCQ